MVVLYAQTECVAALPTKYIQSDGATGCHKTASHDNQSYEADLAHVFLLFEVCDQEFMRTRQLS